MNEINDVWVFNGANSRFPCAVYTNKEQAEILIRKFKLTGILTLYPLNQSIYEWAVANDFFSPKSDKDSSSEFIQRFSSATQEHYHYEDGEAA